MPKISRRDAQMYATNLLIPKINLDPVTGIQEPSREDIAEAKHRVDENEK